MFATVFVLLYVAHLTADYALQTDHQAATKSQPGRAGWTANLAHAGTHVMACAAALGGGAVALDDVSLLLGRAIAAVAWIGVTHALIDRRWPVTWWMDHTGAAGFRARGGAAHVDQTAHILCLAAAALITGA